ncbi:MAG: hypothetical protein JW844_03105 [Candidatus Omnitrophica bacterium]|nr:hypothetical protein [Candidatus Omnitrophota bacterium]
MKHNLLFIFVFCGVFILCVPFFGYAAEIAQELDRDKDGTPDMKIFYSEDGMPQHFEVDRNQDGKKDVWGTFRKGLLYEVEVDSDNNGTPEIWVSYNPDGTTKYQSADKNGDGTPDVWAYFKDNNLVRQELDKNYDGNVDLRCFYQQGQMVALEQDTDLDGAFDRRVNTPDTIQQDVSIEK